ncbi:sugar porter family MFS transporter [Mucilaginibacter sp. UR6-1]|uniref:sugar porter family MFS transporter n=1 Tax=Mucilaginibacter sp. UR6-1 TaxID=1435643 RepID=UPI001E319B82|nr:sugar porter family MFS transporter [Mucilaginibacter sp. UR6-1]MCC8409123.1 sugar porter family MFS transporter [Mucilaginibacter sp. UR6-1]
MLSVPEKYNHSYILFISFVSALGGYLFGFDFAVISGALPFLKPQFQLTALGEGFLTGSLALGCMCGCLIAGKLADQYGRRPALLVSAAIFALSSIAMALSGTLTVFVLFRFAAGIGVGMSSMLSPLYISEISPAAVRGRNVAINQLTVVLGILITNLVNYSLADMDPDAWRWMFGLGVVPSLLFMAGVLFLPESPRWQAGRGQIEKARITFTKISGAAYANTLIDEVGSRSLQEVKTPSGGLFSKAVRPALLIGVTLAVFQQLCGINVVFNYTSTIFSAVGADLDRQLWETVIIGIVNTLFTLFAMWQVDKLGRKPLIMYGSIALSFSYLVLAILLRNQAPAAWISLFVLLAIAVYATSLAPVTWVIISEIFPNHIRGKASSFAILCLWGAYFILVFTFPILAKSLGTFGPFYLYSGICLAGFVFIRLKVKETKGQSLEELESHFSAH